MYTKMNKEHMSTFSYLLVLLSFSTAQIVETRFKTFKFSKSEWEIVVKEKLVVEDGNMECGIACAADTDCTGIFFDANTGTI